MKLVGEQKSDHDCTIMKALPCGSRVQVEIKKRKRKLVLDASPMSTKVNGLGDDGEPSGIPITQCSRDRRWKREDVSNVIDRFECFTNVYFLWTQR